MPMCFVVQPFTDTYNKRFDDLYKPAIEAAGMAAYRVDQDSSATVLVEAIEKNIKRAAVCLADITEDNPNVWYELGFAYAAGRPVVMACSDERQKAGKRFPFDIQHRAIVTYKTESPSDFQAFKDNLTERLKSMLEQGEVLEEMAEQSSVASVDGLSSQELNVLVVVASSVLQDDDAASLWTVRNDCERAGLNNLGFNLGLRRLKAKGFIDAVELHDERGEPYSAVRVTEKAGGFNRSMQHLESA
ncbi:MULTISPECIES: nucleoside 2-deoxyribosyltransferase [unclassified Caballeronia]|uniref:nucleoside 2-deoxyribosyltransferase n=1 Tax=unclassified Caballeronia TaxID=2646786 RepID=UPI001F18023F|nr:MULTISPECIES: nucleoside 2-deoxyribosyltransferase [unclassified Caballeronia]MCE4543252.1 nucleoside 2-deoxyribosyltransferase [Caballeronia sp. PC1]MCE4567692.1 nucleoside 2-deoxyribosyltransferase [Caballeronia sp. CLC5]